LPHDLVIFDLDGTLVDSLPDIAAALNHALAESALAPLPIDVVRTLVGEGVHRLAEKALALQPRRASIDAAHLARAVVAFYTEHPCIASRLYPGIVETLAALKATHRHLAVLTNKPGPVARALLDALGAAALFDVILGDGDGHPRKPAPQAAEALFTQFAVSPAQALMVGDGLPDIALGQAAGCAVAAAAWGYTPREALISAKPDYVLDAPSELLAIGAG
jgi:phosphoglycolate phosphatase